LLLLLHSAIKKSGDPDIGTSANDHGVGAVFVVR
jgi:hypothetical protein